MARRGIEKAKGKNRVPRRRTTSNHGEDPQRLVRSRGEDPERGFLGG